MLRTLAAQYTLIYIFCVSTRTRDYAMYSLKYMYIFPVSAHKCIYCHLIEMYYHAKRLCSHHHTMHVDAHAIYGTRTIGRQLI